MTLAAETSEVSILLVDDEEKLLDSMAAKLKHEGYSVTIAVNGAQAKLKIDSHHYDIIVTDLMMPKMSGERFIQAVRTSKQNRLTPLRPSPLKSPTAWMVQALSTNPRLWPAKATGPEPFEFHTLLETIRKMQVRKK